MTPFYNWPIYTMITHIPLVAGNLPIQTLVLGSGQQVYMQLHMGPCMDSALCSDRWWVVIQYCASDT